jgi:anthranilate phosphoribosyltransferase
MRGRCHPRRAVRLSIGVRAAALAGDEHGIAAHTAILGAGVRLYAAGRCDSVGAGAALASAAIDDGRATATLYALLAA